MKIEWPLLGDKDFIEVGKVFRGMRECMRLTRWEMGIRGGFSENSTERWERGIENITLKTLVSWADVLGFEIVVRAKKKTIAMYDAFNEIGEQDG